MIVLDMEILQSAEESGGKIGNPTPYDKEGVVLLWACMKLKKRNKQPLPEPYAVCLTCR